MKNYLIEQNKNIKDALVNLENNKSKCLIVVDKNNCLKGTLTDGDIRRAMLQNANLSSSIKKYIKKNPLFINESNSSITYIDKFIKKIKENDSIDLIPVIGNDFKVKEIIFKKKFKSFSKNKISPNIPILIMAGGKGTRLKQFTNYFPKPLVPFEDVTALEYIINSFKKYNFRKFFISLNYKKNLIKSYLKESKVKNLTYLEEKTFLGTAGSISMLKKKVKTDFFLINCDTILSINYESLYDYHKKNNYKITLVAAAKDYILPYGSCEIKNNRELKKIKEKPTIKQFANVGLYLIKPEVINLVKSNKNLGMDELIHMVKAAGGKVGVFPVSGDSWVDTGSTGAL